MIRVLEQVQGSAVARPLDDRPQQTEVRELVMSSLDEEHRDADFFEMRGSIRARPPGRVQWNGQEYEPADPRQRDLCLSLGSHSPAGRSAAGDDGRSGAAPRPLRLRRAPSQGRARADQGAGSRAPCMGTDSEA